MKRSVLWPILVLVSMSLMAGSAHAVTTYPVGTCLPASGGGYSYLVGYDSYGFPIWEHRDSCPNQSSGESSDLGFYNGLRYLTYHDALANAHGMNTFFMGFSMRALEAMKKAKLYDSKGKGWKYDKKASWGSKPPRPGQRDQFEPSQTKTGEWAFSFTGGTTYRRTDYRRVVPPMNGNDPVASVYSETFNLTIQNESFAVSFLVPVEREKFNYSHDRLDHTTTGLSIVPRYRILKHEVHHVDLTIGGNVGYRHTWYDHDSQIDRPTSARFGAGDFDNPNVASAGLGLGLTVPALFGTLGMAVSHQWAWDLNNDDALAGDKSVEFTIGSVRYDVPIWKTLYATAGGHVSHARGVADQWDHVVYAMTAGLGCEIKGWNLSLSASRDLDDKNVDEVICTLGVGKSW